MTNGYPPRVLVSRIREMYPTGRRVELISMSDPYSMLRPGNQGTVEFVDDMGTCFIAWDSGSHLGAVYREDKIRRI